MYLRIQTSQASLLVSTFCFVFPILAYLIMYFTGSFNALTRATGGQVGSEMHRWLGWSRQFAADYVVGCLVAMQFIGAHGVRNRWPSVLNRIEVPVRWFAAHTFSLYLAHFPSMYFYIAVFAHDPDDIVDGLKLWAAVLFAVLLISKLTEERRANVRRVLVEKFGGLVLENPSSRSRDRG